MNQTPDTTRPSDHGAPPALETAAWAVVVLAGLVWTWFAAGDITWYDSGELVAAAFHLGLSHPPGQPAYGLLGKLATFLPLGSVAFRCNLLSALAATGILALLAVLAHRVAGPRAAFVAVVLTALSWPMAEQAMRAEVYAPALATILAAFVLASRPRLPRSANLAAASVLLGLASGLHPLLAATAWLGMALAFLVVPRETRRWRLATAAFLGALLGNVIWLTLPMAGNKEALIPWSDLDSFGGVLATIMGQAYRQNLQGGASGLGLRLIANARLAGTLAGPAMTAGGLVGVMTLLSAKRTPASSSWPTWVLLGTGLVCSSAVVVFYPANPDIHGYLLPSLAGLALAGSTGLVRLFDWLQKRAQGRRGIAMAGAALLGAMLVWSALQQAPQIADQTRRIGQPRDLTGALERGALPGPGLVVAESDHALFALVYAKAVESVRPDLALASRWLVGSAAPWYRRWLKRRWPWLFVPLVDDEGPTRGMRRRFERINALAIPTYVEEPEPEIWDMVQPCGPFFAFIPKRVSRRACLAASPLPKIEAPAQARLIGCYMACQRARFLAVRGNVQAALDLLAPFVAHPVPSLPPVASEFLCTAARPLVLAGRLELALGNPGRAKVLLERAIHIDPRFADSYAELGRMLAAEGHLEQARRRELQALRYDEKNVTALFYLALIEYRMGRTKRAKAILNRARALDPRQVEALLRAHGAGDNGRKTPDINGATSR